MWPVLTFGFGVGLVVDHLLFVPEGIFVHFCDIFLDFFCIVAFSFVGNFNPIFSMDFLSPGKAYSCSYLVYFCAVFICKVVHMGLNLAALKEVFQLMGIDMAFTQYVHSRYIIFDLCSTFCEL